MYCATNKYCTLQLVPFSFSTVNVQYRYLFICNPKMGPERRDLGPDWKNLNLSHSATLHNSPSQFIYLFIYSAAKSRKRQQQTTNNTTNSITKKNNIQYAYTTRRNHDRSHSNKHLPRHPLLLRPFPLPPMSKQLLSTLFNR